MLMNKKYPQRLLASRLLRSMLLSPRRPLLMLLGTLHVCSFVVIVHAFHQLQPPRSFSWMESLGPRYDVQHMIGRQAFVLQGSRMIKHHRRYAASNHKEEDDGHDDTFHISSSDNQQEKHPEEVFYNDFDFTIGEDNVDATTAQTTSWSNAAVQGDTGSAATDSLRLPVKFEKVLQQESKRKMLIEKNWQTGNWKCRGFSLDPFRPDIMKQNGDGSDDRNIERVEISQIAFDETVTCDAAFGSATETIAVGRTDGTVYVVTLGEEYLTKFRAVANLSSAEGGVGACDDSLEDGKDASSTVRLGMEMIREDDRKKDSEDFSNESMSSPFEIECQFQAHEKDEPISSLLFHDDILYTASKKSGQIKGWKMDHVDGKAIVVPSCNLHGAHNDEVVVLKTLSHQMDVSDAKDHNLLLSASRDGSFALWDMNGDLVYRCEMEMIRGDSHSRNSDDDDDDDDDKHDDDDEHVQINCADVDTSSGSEHLIYFGLSDGYVVVYSVSDLLDHASEGNTCTMPRHRFLAHDPLDKKWQNGSHVQGVTAIACGRSGSIGTTSQVAQSRILVTGGADGCMKQWDMIQQGSKGDKDGESKLMHWPRLPTQKVKGRAHVFKGHEGPITAIKYDEGENASKIVSAGADGSIRVWNPQLENEMYRMDGFENISSICLDKEILVTNGMNQYVCIHDFDTHDEIDERFDLDW